MRPKEQMLVTGRLDFYGKALGVAKAHGSFWLAHIGWLKIYSFLWKAQ